VKKWWTDGDSGELTEIDDATCATRSELEVVQIRLTEELIPDTS